MGVQPPHPAHHLHPLLRQAARNSGAAPHPMSLHACVAEPGIGAAACASARFTRASLRSAAAAEATVCSGASATSADLDDEIMSALDTDMFEDLPATAPATMLGSGASAATAGAFPSAMFACLANGFSRLPDGPANHRLSKFITNDSNSNSNGNVTTSSNRNSKRILSRPLSQPLATATRTASDRLVDSLRGGEPANRGTGGAAPLDVTTELVLRNPALAVNALTAGGSHDGVFTPAAASVGSAGWQGSVHSRPCGAARDGMHGGLPSDVGLPYDVGAACSRSAQAVNDELPASAQHPPLTHESPTHSCATSEQPLPLPSDLQPCALGSGTFPSPRPHLTPGIDIRPQLPHAHARPDTCPTAAALVAAAASPLSSLSRAAAAGSAIPLSAAAAAGCASPVWAPDAGTCSASAIPTNAFSFGSPHPLAGSIAAAACAQMPRSEPWAPFGLASAVSGGFKHFASAVAVGDGKAFALPGMYDALPDLHAALRAGVSSSSGGGLGADERGRAAAAAAAAMLEGLRLPGVPALTPEARTLPPGTCEVRRLRAPHGVLGELPLPYNVAGAGGGDAGKPPATAASCPLPPSTSVQLAPSGHPSVDRYLQQLLADTSSPELHLFLCKRQLNTAACRAVASCLRACAAAGRAVRSITLSGCGISCEGLTALCDGLRHCSFTLILDLSHNAIGDTGAAALAAVLGNLSCLINVQLGGNAELGDLGAAALAAAARSCPSLRRIALRGTAASIFSIKDINSALSANAKRAVLARGKSGNALANAISSVVAAAANGITVGPDRPITWDGSCSGAMPAAAAAAAALPGLVSAAAAAAAGNPRVTVSSSGRRASSSSTNGEDPVFVAQLCGLLRTLVQPVLPAEMAVMRLVSELVAQRQAQGDAASAQQHQQLQQEGFGLRGPDLDTYITPGRKRFGRVSELDCIADEAADIAVAAGPFPDLAHGFDTVSSSSGSGSPSAEAEAEGRGAAETAALLSYLADGLMRYGYDVAVTHTLGGGAGGQCLRNLRHTFLSVTCPRQHPDAASNPNSAPCSLAAAGATLAGAAAAAAATVTATGSLGTNSVGGSLSQPYGATAVQMPCHAGVIIVDPELREQFDVANPTPRYEALVGTLPRVYVGAEERLPLVVEVLCDEMALAFRTKGQVLPPWRESTAMISKWQPKLAASKLLVPASETGRPAGSAGTGSVGRGQTRGSANSSVSVTPRASLCGGLGFAPIASAVPFGPAGGFGAGAGIVKAGGAKPQGSCLRRVGSGAIASSLAKEGVGGGGEEASLRPLMPLACGAGAEAGGLVGSRGVGSAAGGGYGFRRCTSEAGPMGSLSFPVHPLQAPGR